jgi:hypothetical protein
MKRSLKIAANTLANGRSRAYVSRVAWFDLERLVRAAFNELSESSEEIAELGRLSLTKNQDYPPFNESHFTPVNITNQIQVQAGWRPLGLSHSTTENGEARAEPLAESGATLWFSQGATGFVTVFLAPYKSKAMSMNEENIILARYNCASSVTALDVQRHFATYFWYCSITSVHGNFGLSGYIYLLWLKYKDSRYANQKQRVKLIELLIAVVAIVATLYAGDKLFIN